MEVGIGMSGDLSKEELRSLMQAIRTWGEQLGDRVVGFTIDAPELTRQEVIELLGDIYPIVGEFALPPAPGKLLRFGPRMIVVGDSMLATCDDMAITVAEATDEEIECFENASEIKLVKIMKG